MWLSRACLPREDDAGSVVGEESESPAAVARQQPAAHCSPLLADSLTFLLVYILALASQMAFLFQSQSDWAESMSGDEIC